MKIKTKQRLDSVVVTRLAHMPGGRGLIPRPGIRRGCLFTFWTPALAAGSYEMRVVRPSVRTYVRTQRFFSGTVHYFFLKLSMILKYHKG